MQYDPIKKSLGNVVRKSIFLRKVFYNLLDILFLRAWFVKRELRKVLSHSQAQSLYDAGCGFGQYSYFCASTFPKTTVHAVDVKDEQIEDCKQFFRDANLKNATFAVEDLTKATHTNRFDVILSVDVMEHIEDDIQVFKNFFQAMKSGGVLLVNTPSDLAEHADEDDHQHGGHGFIDEHVRDGYSPSDITTKLTSVGFKIERISYSYGFWGNLSWLLAIKYPMLLLNISKVFFVILPFYYLITFPFALLLMLIDYIGENKSGAGLIAVARKP